MKRIGQLFHQITEPNNLCLAFWKATKGKQNKPDVIAFRNNFNQNICILHDQLIRLEPDIGHYRFFTVHDPKQRDICAASFPERVLHHAVMNICEPVLDAYAIYDSYACRKGKGVHKAVSRAKKFSAKYNWYLKLDISKYFNSIDHKTVNHLLARRIKDNAVLTLFDKILSTYHTEPGKGLPIGNLVSQHLANFYLSTFDHWIKEQRRIRGYLRYMDDFILFSHEKSRLKKELDLIKDYLADHLKLILRPGIQLNRCTFGVPFLGYRIYPDKILLSPSSKTRFVRKFRAYEQKWAKGKWTMETLCRHVEPLIEFTKTADAGGFRRNIIERFGVLS